MAVFYIQINQQTENISVNWQRELAKQQIAPLYQQINGLVCCLLVGSSARNLQRDFSDVDLVMYWDNIPSELQRIQIIEQATGIITEMYDSSEDDADISLQSQSDVFYLLGDKHTGIKIDVTHKTVTSAEKLIDDVVIRYETKRIKFAILHSLHHSLTLVGEDWMMARLAQIGDEMPMRVAVKLIEDNIRFNPIWIFDMFAGRPDPILYHRFRSKNLDQMLMVLGAVNRLYMPDGFKHLDAFIDELTIQPDRLGHDIYQILDSDPAIAKPTILRLGDAIHDLVAHHFPDIDIQDARDGFHYVRPRHEGALLLKETRL